MRCKAKSCYKIAVGATSLCRMHSSAMAAAAAAGVGASASASASAGGVFSSTDASDTVPHRSAQGSMDDGDNDEEEEEEDDDESMDEQAVLYAAGRK